MVRKNNMVHLLPASRHEGHGAGTIQEAELYICSAALGQGLNAGKGFTRVGARVPIDGLEPVSSAESNPRSGRGVGQAFDDCVAVTAIGEHKQDLRRQSDGDILLERRDVLADVGRRWEGNGSERR